MVKFAIADQSPQVLSWSCGIETCVEWRLVLCLSHSKRTQKDCSVTWTKNLFISWPFHNTGELYCLVSQGVYAGNHGLDSH